MVKNQARRNEKASQNFLNEAAWKIETGEGRRGRRRNMSPGKLVSLTMLNEPVEGDGLMIVHHGLSDESTKYYHLLRQFKQEGVSVAAVDFTCRAHMRDLIPAYTEARRAMDAKYGARFNRKVNVCVSASGVLLWGVAQEEDTPIRGDSFLGVVIPFGGSRDGERWFASGWREKIAIALRGELAYALDPRSKEYPYWTPEAVERFSDVMGPKYSFRAQEDRHTPRKGMSTIGHIRDHDRAINAMDGVFTRPYLGKVPVNSTHDLIIHGTPEGIRMARDTANMSVALARGEHPKDAVTNTQIQYTDKKPFSFII